MLEIPAMASPLPGQGIANPQQVTSPQRSKPVWTVPEKLPVRVGVTRMVNVADSPPLKLYVLPPIMLKPSPDTVTVPVIVPPQTLLRVRVISEDCPTWTIA